MERKATMNSQANNIDEYRNFRPMVACGVCGRTHENYPHADCRAFKLCPKCGDGYLNHSLFDKYNTLPAHMEICDGTPSANVKDEQSIEEV
jgi:uncharacterized protein (DUF983 family)